MRCCASSAASQNHQTDSSQHKSRGSRRRESTSSLISQKITAAHYHHRLRHHHRCRRVCVLMIIIYNPLMMPATHTEDQDQDPMLGKELSMLNTHTYYRRRYLERINIYTCSPVWHMINHDDFLYRSFQIFEPNQIPHSRQFHDTMIFVLKLRMVS